MAKVRVKFPIIRNVSEGGQHLTKSLDENDVVKCVFCGYPITLDYRTTHLAEDGMQMVDCPKCKQHVSVLYYFDKAENHKKDPIKVAYHRGQRARRGGI